MSIESGVLSFDGCFMLSFPISLLALFSNRDYGSEPGSCISIVKAEDYGYLA